MSDDNELEALRNKNRELLDELKKARAKNGELEQIQEDLLQAQAEVQELKLHRPVPGLLAKILIPPNTFSIKEVMEDYTFQLDNDGNVQMLNGDDPVDFTVEGITEFLGSQEKYAGVVRAMARNETVDTAASLPTERPKTHFGMR